jgi:hypothetical protein
MLMNCDRWNTNRIGQNALKSILCMTQMEKGACTMTANCSVLWNQSSLLCRSNISHQRWGQGAEDIQFISERERDVRPSEEHICDTPKQTEINWLRGLLENATFYGEQGEVVFRWKVFRPDKYSQKRMCGYLFVPIYQRSADKFLPYSGLTLKAMARLFSSHKGDNALPRLPDWIRSGITGASAKPGSEESKLWTSMRKAIWRFAREQKVPNPPGVGNRERSLLCVCMYYKLTFLQYSAGDRQAHPQQDLTGLARTCRTLFNQIPSVVQRLVSRPLTTILWPVRTTRFHFSAILRTVNFCTARQNELVKDPARIDKFGNRAWIVSNT